jgi:hypothetical protein
VKKGKNVKKESKQEIKQAQTSCNNLNQPEINQFEAFYSL